MRRLLPLALIEVFVWLVLLLGAFLISRLALNINLGGSNLMLTVATDGVRAGVAAAILLGWLVAWRKMTDFYFWRTVKRK